MQHYFITGATGVVGSAFLKRILGRRQPATLLIRADSEASANDRLKRVMLTCDIPSHCRRQIRLVRGDLCLPDMGLDADDYRHLRTTCTHIVHCAGNVRMNRPLHEARRETMATTLNVLELMSASETAKNMEFVSTVGIAGRMTGGLGEAWVERPRAFRNSYEAAKAEAENAVRQFAAAGLPITVHRPSMVVGDSRTGQTVSFQVFYYLSEFLSGARSYGLLPKLNGTRLDVIPSDYVAALLEASGLNIGSRPPILHSCSGENGAIDLSALVNQVRRLFAQNGRRLPPIHYLPAPLFKLATTMIKPLLPPKARRALGSLPHFLSYLEEKQHFSNQITKKFIRSRGIELPKADEVIDTVLQYYLTARQKGQPL